MRKIIAEFHGRFYFLSNFFPCSFQWRGIIAPTSEHHFQAAKAIDTEERDWVYLAATPASAKRRGRSIECRSDWDDIKVDIMRDILKAKFNILTLRQLLDETKGYELIEGNTWGDTFWGQCPIDNGENWLGRILMEIRDE